MLSVFIGPLRSRALAGQVQRREPGGSKPRIVLATENDGDGPGDLVSQPRLA